MSKQKAPRRVAENEALAVGTTIRGSAQKLNLVAGLIRGKKAEGEESEGEAGENAAPGGIGQREERGIEAVGVVHSHQVQ